MDFCEYPRCVVNFITFTSVSDTVTFEKNVWKNGPLYIPALFLYISCVFKPGYLLLSLFCIVETRIYYRNAYLGAHVFA